jgi:carnitine O-acetyltransferase
MAPGAIRSDEKSEVNKDTSSIHQGPDSKKAFNATTIEINSKGLGESGAKEGIGGGKTFARQHELPKLPIPKLEDTCSRYLTSLQPLQSTQEHERTTSVVEAFLKVREECVRIETVHFY